MKTTKGIASGGKTASLVCNFGEEVKNDTSREKWSTQYNMAVNPPNRKFAIYVTSYGPMFGSRGYIPGVLFLRGHHAKSQQLSAGVSWVSLGGATREGGLCSCFDPMQSKCTSLLRGAGSKPNIRRRLRSMQVSGDEKEIRRVPLRFVDEEVRPQRLMSRGRGCNVLSSLSEAERRDRGLRVDPCTRGDQPALGAPRPFDHSRKDGGIESLKR